MGIYDTPQEARDVELLADLDWEVVNPNCSQIEALVTVAKSNGDVIMLLFKPIIEDCDVFAFRALPDGSISSGVAMEIQWAWDAGLEVIELPSAMTRRFLTHVQTTEYLLESGNR